MNEGNVRTIKVPEGMLDAINAILKMKCSFLNLRDGTVLWSSSVNYGQLATGSGEDVLAVARLVNNSDRVRLEVAFRWFGKAEPEVKVQMPSTGEAVSVWFDGKRYILTIEPEDDRDQEHH